MATLRDLQLVELDLIRAFVDICEKEGLTYYLLGGTLLGAVRHKGYIPWDDDADIGLPRPDYEKFLMVAKKYLPEDYQVESYKATPGYKFYFSRLTCAKQKVKVYASQKESIQNAWIDIFPLDGMPNQKYLNKIHQGYLMFLRALYKFSVFDTHVGIHLPNRVWYEKALISFCKYMPIQKLFSTRRRLDSLDHALKKYSYENSNYLVNFMGAYKFREMFLKDVYAEGALYEFEGLQLNGPKDYDFVCTQLYGDYMTPPPDAEKNKHFTEMVQEE